MPKYLAEHVTKHVKKGKKRCFNKHDSIMLRYEQFAWRRHSLHRIPHSTRLKWTHRRHSTLPNHPILSPPSFFNSSQPSPHPRFINNTTPPSPPKKTTNYPPNLETRGSAPSRPRARAREPINPGQKSSPPRESGPLAKLARIKELTGEQKKKK